MLVRAEKLVNGLHDESIRWSQSIADLEKQLTNLTGNMLLSAGYISYVGTFTAKFRDQLLLKWQQECVDMEIPHSDDFSIEG